MDIDTLLGLILRKISNTTKKKEEKKNVENWNGACLPAHVILWWLIRLGLRKKKTNQAPHIYIHFLFIYFFRFFFCFFFFLAYL